jgi:hypothetical protein
MHCSQTPFSARKPKQAHGLPRAPAWASGLTTDGRAAKVACARRPPGPKCGPAAAGGHARSRPSKRADLIRRSPASFGGIKRTCAACYPQTLEHSFPHTCPDTPDGGGGVARGRLVAGAGEEHRPPEAASGFFLLYTFSSPHSLPNTSTGEMRGPRPHGCMEETGSGTAAGPLAGERVPHAGERTAVEGMHGGALGPNPHGGEASTSPGSPLSARVRALGGTGSGRDGEVGVQQIPSRVLFLLVLGLGFRI